MGGASYAVTAIDMASDQRHADLAEWLSHSKPGLLSAEEEQQCFALLGEATRTLFDSGCVSFINLSRLGAETLARLWPHVQCWLPQLKYEIWAHQDSLREERLQSRRVCGILVATKALEGVGVHSFPVELKRAKSGILDMIRPSFWGAPRAALTTQKSRNSLLTPAHHPSELGDSFASCALSGRS